MFSSLEPRMHGGKKKRISNIYSKSFLQSSTDIASITRVVLEDRMMPRLNGLAKTGTPLDVMALFQAAAMDSATAYFFGLRSSTKFLQDDKARAHWLELYLRSRPRDCMIFLQELPEFTRLLAKLGINLVPRSREAYNDRVDAWCLTMCDGAEATLARATTETVPPGENPAVYTQLQKATAKEGCSDTESVILSCFKDSSKSSDPEKRDPNYRSPQQLEIASELLDQLIATHETFGITLTYIAWELSRHVEMQRRLRTEIRSLGAGIRYPSANEGESAPLPGAKTVDEIPILHSIIMETLRLHPAVPGAQPRNTPADGTVKLGDFDGIPSGVRVQAYAWGLHRDVTAFPDPLGWHPERWLEGEEGAQWQGSDKKERWFWAFGSGGRMCVGSNFAMQSKYFEFSRACWRHSS